MEAARSLLGLFYACKFHPRRQWSSYKVRILASLKRLILALQTVKMDSINAASPATPEWLNKGDNAWQITAATLIGLQCVPGLVILYGSIVKKKWAVNSAFMALYAFAAVLICWVTWAYNMAFGEPLLPFWGKPSPALGQKFLLQRANLPSTRRFNKDGSLKTAGIQPLFPMASLVYYQFAFAALTVVMLAGSALGRMNFRAWMMFVPLWLTFSYTIGAYSLWGGGFLHRWGVIDYAGGYVIHVSSGAAGVVLAYRVGTRLRSDRERFPPNNVLLTLTGAGLLWLGWSGFNGGATYASNLISSMAVLNTHICAATSMLTWTFLDVIYFEKPSVIGAVQGMMTGLVCITPGAGLVQGWAAIVTGVLGGSIPWFTMMVVHRRSNWLQKIDDTLAVFHTHAVSGVLGGLLVGLFADPTQCDYFLLIKGQKGAFYGNWFQVVKQICGALFVMAWNVIATNVILSGIGLFIPLRMSDEELMIGDDAAHGEEAYALWGDGEQYEMSKHQNRDASLTNTSHVATRLGFSFEGRVRDVTVGI